MHLHRLYPTLFQKIIAVLFALGSVAAFAPEIKFVSQLAQVTNTGISTNGRNIMLEMAKKKGFGNNPSPPSKSKKQTQVFSEDNPPPSQMITSSDDRNFNNYETTTITDDGTQTKTQTQPVQEVSRGKLELEKLRRKKAEQRNAELSKMKEVQDVDRLVRETGGEAAVIPEKVAQRMGKRMLPFVGIPLLGGMGLFVGFWYMATYKDMEFQPVLVAGTTIALLSIGLLGITYSMLSASWDEEREGSVLGTEEFSRNIENIKGGLTRSRDNAQIREQIMREANRSQIQGNKGKKTTQSLEEKIRDGLD